MIYDICRCGVLVLDQIIGQYVTHGYYLFWNLGHWLSQPHGFAHHIPVGDDHPNFCISCPHLKTSFQEATTSNSFETKIFDVYCSLLCILGRLRHKLFSAFCNRICSSNWRFGENRLPPCLGPQAPIYGELEPAKLDM